MQSELQCTPSRGIIRVVVFGALCCGLAPEMRNSRAMLALTQAVPARAMDDSVGTLTHMHKTAGTALRYALMTTRPSPTS